MSLFHCSHCQEELTIPPEHSGESLQCHSCCKLVSIPAELLARLQQQGKPVSEPTTVERDHSNQSDSENWIPAIIFGIPAVYFLLMWWFGVTRFLSGLGGFLMILIGLAHACCLFCYVEWLFENQRTPEEYLDSSLVATILMSATGCLLAVLGVLFGWGWWTGFTSVALLWILVKFSPEFGDPAESAEPNKSEGDAVDRPDHSDEKGRVAVESDHPLLNAVATLRGPSAPPDAEPLPPWMIVVVVGLMGIAAVCLSLVWWFGLMGFLSGLAICLMWRIAVAHAWYLFCCVARFIENQRTPEEHHASSIVSTILVLAAGCVLAVLVVFVEWGWWTGFSSASVLFGVLFLSPEFGDHEEAAEPDRMPREAAIVGLPLMAILVTLCWFGIYCGWQWVGNSGGPVNPPVVGPSGPPPPTPPPVQLPELPKNATAEQITSTFKSQVYLVLCSYSESRTMQGFLGPYVKRSKGTVSGSAVLIAHDLKHGLIVTNRHVIDPGYRHSDISTWHSRVQVKNPRDAGFTPARIAAFHKDRDLALLLIDRKWDAVEAIPVIKQQTTHQGERAVALGNPRGFEFFTSIGIISGKAEGMIGTTCQISRGSSGGPLFLNRHGYLVGITTLMFSGQNLNFAEPAEAIVANRDSWDWERAIRQSLTLDEVRRQLVDEAAARASNREDASKQSRIKMTKTTVTRLIDLVPLVSDE